jgi:hypothetical protein
MSKPIWDGKKRITVIQALKLHILLWRWLAETGSNNKTNWPEWAYNKGNVPTADNDCFMCERVGFDDGGDPNCQHCPLKGKWTRGGIASNCEAEGALYVKWNCSESLRWKKYFAGKIADIGEEKLAELRAKKRGK